MPTPRARRKIVSAFREKSKTTGVNPEECRGVSHPPLCGIIRLTNSDALRFRNWSLITMNPCGEVSRRLDTCREV